MNDINDVDKEIINHPNADKYPIIIKAYKAGFLGYYEALNKLNGNIEEWEKPFLCEEETENNN